MALVERLIIIDNGKIVMDGTKEKVLEALKGGSNG
jgi:ABC-type multidrug transport system ATPase subunit